MHEVICQQSGRVIRARAPRAMPARGGTSGLARRHDTNDTNQASGDTRTIRCTGKMIGVGTPAHSLLRRERELWQLHLFWRPTVIAGCWIGAAVMYQITPGISKYLAASAARCSCPYIILCS